MHLPPWMLCFSELLHRDRGDFHRLLGEAVEEFSSGAGGAAVEAEREFVQVVIQIRMADGPWVGC